MPFIRQDRLDELNRKARNYEDNAKVEKRYRRSQERLQAQYEDRIDDINDAHAEEVHKLNRQIEKTSTAVKRAVEEATENHTQELVDLQVTLDKAVAAKDAEIKALKDENKVLEARTVSAIELKKRELDLKDAEAAAERTAKLLETREKALDKKIAEFDARVKDENETQYKLGFTDGVSTTLREGNTAAETAHENVYKLADKALSKDTTVITTTTPTTKSK